MRDKEAGELPQCETCDQYSRARAEQQSFWRILYMRKNPLVPQIWHEYILVCEKPLFLLSEKNTEENP